MSIFTRLSTLLKANINDLISKAEDPEKVLNQLIVDMNQQLVEAKKHVAVAIADEKRLKRQWENEAKLGEQWNKKAMTAVRSQRDDLAKQALARQQQHGQQAAGFGEQWQAQKTASDTLRSQLQQLSGKIEEAKRKKNLLIARARRVEAQKKIQQTMHGIAENSAFDAFDRLAEKVEQSEAEAEAQAELSGMITGDTLAEEFKQLEGDGTDSALAALKAQMGLAAAADASAALPAATTAPADAQVDELEAELAAMKSSLVDAPVEGGDGGGRA